MKSSYKPISDIVERVDIRNSDGNADILMGLSIDKCFIRSVANTVGTDLKKYKVIRRNQFAVSLMQVSRDSKIPVACFRECDRAIMSPAYSIFQVADESVVLPDYLDMWFKRAEFDREAAFIAVGGVRGSMPWEEFARIKVRVPTIDEQRSIVKAYQTITERIELKRRINDNLERQALALVAEYSARTFCSSAFSNIMNFDNGFAFQSRTYLSSGKYKIITIKNVQDGCVDSTGAVFIDCLPQRMKDNCILNIGDVLLSLTGNVGRVGVVCERNLLLNQRVAKIVPTNYKLLPFLYFVFRQSEIKTKLETIAKGTAQLNLSPTETLKLTIPYEESSAIQLSQLLEPLYRKIIYNNQESYSLTLLRDSLLPKLMSGEIDVSAVQL